MIEITEKLIENSPRYSTHLSKKEIRINHNTTFNFGVMLEFGGWPCGCLS